MKIVQTAGRDALGEFAPEFAHLNDDVLFGEVWNNTDIDLKTRSIITVVALMSSGITDSSLKYHLRNAKNHGVSRSEIAAIVTHVAFYVGWPKAWAVLNMAKEIWPTGAFEQTAQMTGGAKAEQHLADKPISEAMGQRVSEQKMTRQTTMQENGQQAPEQNMTRPVGESAANKADDRNLPSDAALLQMVMAQMAAEKLQKPSAEVTTQAGASGEKHPCPVCGKHKFANANAKSICPKCGWENDLAMENDPDNDMYESNDCSLNEFRERYQTILRYNPAYSYSRDGIPV